MASVSASTVAPSGGAVLADTGAVTEAGAYDVTVVLAVQDTVAVNKGITAEHRNVANNATLTILAACAAAGQLSVTIPRFQLEAGERLRCVSGGAAGAASSRYIAAIHYQRVS